MTLPPFEVHRPATVSEAGALLLQYGDGASFYCGGTELLLLMKLGFAHYEHFIQVRHLPELHGIAVEDGMLRIGAATTHRQLERSPLIQDRLPALASMERAVANIRVRTAGSLGGNLCFADPHSDPATFLLATGAQLLCLKGDAHRTLPIDGFVLGPYQTLLEESEILAEIRIPIPDPNVKIVHKKLSFNERPAATVTTMVTVGDGRTTDVRVAVGSVGVVPVRVSPAENELRDMAASAPDLRRLEAAAEAASEVCGAVEDANGSEEYKRNLVRVLVKRGFMEALG
ncbi:MAG: FAD binding domain-containing protein [Chloroflexota bacterium]